MPLLATFFLRYWKPLLLMALMAGALAYRAVLLHQRDEARAALARVTADNELLQSANRAMGAEVNRQNAAVTELKTRADAAVNVMAADMAAAASAGSAAADAAGRQEHALIAAPIAPDAGCEGAIRWGNHEAAELSTW